MKLLKPPTKKNTNKRAHKQENNLTIYQKIPPTLSSKSCCRLFPLCPPALRLNDDDGLHACICVGVRSPATIQMLQHGRRCCGGGSDCGQVVATAANCLTWEGNENGFKWTKSNRPCMVHPRLCQPLPMPYWLQQQQQLVERANGLACGWPNCKCK